MDKSQDSHHHQGVEAQRQRKKTEKTPPCSGGVDFIYETSY
jgi:hypothetical protein